MELSIRSQDKEHLIKYDNLYINKNDNGIRTTYRIMTDFITLGIYESKERAIEVLDEIQNIINPKAILQAKGLLSRETMRQIQEDYDMTVIPSCVDIIQPISTSIVYEMPEE